MADLRRIAVRCSRCEWRLRGYDALNVARAQTAYGDLDLDAAAAVLAARHLILAPLFGNNHDGASVEVVQ